MSKVPSVVFYCFNLNALFNLPASSNPPRYSGILTRILQVLCEANSIIFVLFFLMSFLPVDVEHPHKQAKQTHFYGGEIRNAMKHPGA